MSREELYEITRGHWKVGKRREGATYALAVAKGVVHEVFEIECWQKAGTDTYRLRRDGDAPEGRWEFVGQVAPANARSRYLGRSVRTYLRRGNQNPITYVNC